MRSSLYKRSWIFGIILLCLADGNVAWSFSRNFSQGFSQGFSQSELNHDFLTSDDRFTQQAQTPDPATDSSADLNVDPQAQADRLYESGWDLIQQGHYSEAITTYQQALDLYQELENHARVADCLYAIGTIHQRQGTNELALDFYQQAHQIYEQTHDPEGQWKVLTTIGAVYSALGQYAEALTVQQQALAIVQTLNSPVDEQNVLTNLAFTSFYLGQYDQALALYQQALKLSQTEGLPADDRMDNEGSIFNGLGLLYDRLQQYDLAIESYQKAIALKREIGARTGEANSLSALGYVYYRADQPELALPALEQAIAIFTQLGDRDGIAYTQDSLGLVHAQLQQFDQAWQTYQQALAILEEIGDRPAQRQTLSNIGDLLVAQNQPELAIVFYKQSVNITEAIRQDLQELPIDQQQSYTNTIAETYRHLAELLIEQNRILEAQQVLDLLKVQEIQDYLRRGVRSSDSTNDPTNDPTTGVYLLTAESQVLVQFQQLLEQGRRLAELQALPPDTLTPDQQTELRQLEASRSQIQASFNQFLDRLDVQTALQHLRLNTPQSLDLEALRLIRRDLTQARPDAVFLYPLILDDRLELIVLSPHLPPTHKTVPVTRLDLNQTIVSFLSKLQDPQSDPRPEAAQLYDWLIRPIESFLTAAEANVILYAPDGQLRYIPLAALYDGQQWFIEKYQINQLTAFSLFDLNTPPRPQPRILAGAFSDGRYIVSRRDGEAPIAFNGLPFAKVEVETIGGLFPQTRQLINQDFTEAATVPFLNQYNIVHFATHAMFTTGSPDDSFILMGDGQTIDINDIRNLDLGNVDLMILSGCQTAVGSLNAGQSLGDGVEILGFGYQVQNAGARATIASLWSVDDGGTEALMSQFYARLQEGTAKAAALQQAQVALIQAEALPLPAAVAQQRDRSDAPQLDPQQLTHPYYWAPFILIGNGL